MDRAYLVREAWRRVLLGALFVQVLTPDVLDLSLLSQSLPPGPIFVVSSLSAPASAAEPAATLDREDRDTGDLCEPFWPEVGLTRVRSVDTVPRTKLGTGATVGISLPPTDSAGLRPPMIPARGIPRPSLYCRLTC
jgi:hypothetical protein